MSANCPSSTIANWPISASIARTFRALQPGTTTADLPSAHVTNRQRPPCAGVIVFDFCTFHCSGKGATCLAMTGIQAASDTVHIVGAGLAGSEAAWQLANAGVHVVLHEMRPTRMTEAHRTDSLAELDAIAPIVHKDSIDMSVAWFQSRYDKVGPGGTDADYVNCPMTKEQYDAFVDALLAGEKVDFKDWETNTPYFDGCLPVEVMAERGHETLRHGPMKPVGLTNPNDPTVKPYAIVQLRQDNKLGTLYNIVGFQTKLKHGAQQRVFRTIPGLENAEFARLGGLHRNTFLNSPKLLDSQLRLRARPRLRFAGQMTGCEGYVESASIGLIAGLYAAANARSQFLTPPPSTTALGSLLGHITGGHIETVDAGPPSFQPMNINFGLFPPLASAPTKKPDGSRLRGNEKTVAKKQAMSARALADLERWIADHLRVAAAA